MSHFLYLALNAGVISLPLAFSFHPKFRFVREWRAFFPACLSVAAGFIIWDVYFTSQGIWGFNPNYLVGWSLLGLPLEEWLFFVCIPYACVFTYYTIGHRYPFSLTWSKGLVSSIFAISLFVLVGRWGHWYSMSASIGVIFLCIGLLAKSPAWMPALMSSFSVLIIPFIGTNGILTGLKFWEYPFLNRMPDMVTDQVVWYNNAENIGIRLWTIPLDDFLYAFLLIGLNIVLFETFRSQKQFRTNAKG